uniref:Uncharacterized protein n=1 Tax=Lactuca sativa TaxID=4236 RepID=A0A9R1UL30_LACSA|nr:hypothetical protein LSAT_V11C800406460 [Lactuca sativa]
MICRGCFVIFYQRVFTYVFFSVFADNRDEATDHITSPSLPQQTFNKTLIPADPASIPFFFHFVRFYPGLSEDDQTTVGKPGIVSYGYGQPFHFRQAILSTRWSM